jgi:6-phosphofructokinase 1
MMNPSNLLIVQGGGPTAVFNVSLAGIIEESLKHPRIDKIYGALKGMQGLAHDEIVNLTSLSSPEIQAVRSAPGAALGSSRFKPSEEDFVRAVKCLRRLDIGFVIFMGGNGTMRGAGIFEEFCRHSGISVQIVGVPKTIDNDINATDRSPGYASAARFVAQSTLDLATDLRALNQPVSIFETLGRDVGWLAAASTLAKQSEDDAPHLVYIPEVPFQENDFLGKLDNVVSRVGWALVVVSEGISYAGGTPVFQQQFTLPDGTPGRPLIGNVAQHLSRRVSELLGLRCRSEKPGLIGRCCVGQSSAQDLEDADLVGREAVSSLLAGETGKMVSLNALSHNAQPSTSLVTFAAAGGAGRAVPKQWHSDDSLAVTDAFRDYLRPLVGPLAAHTLPNVFHSRDTSHGK